MVVGKEKKNSSSRTFKTGAVSLAFLIIGYQIALFVHRAAVLRVESIRDNPDTVFVISVPEASQRESEISFTAARCSVSRTVAPHPPAVKALLENIRPVESFEFDPNEVSVEELKRLGFSDKQANSILAYRQKGGRFRRKSDFAKSYVVPDSVFRRLEPYIKIPAVDINLADSAQFDALPGIGGWFAARMVSYREELGGYSYPEQLMDIYHFDKEKYDGLSDLISCSPPSEPFKLWSLSASELRRHPYIRSWQTARSIELFRSSEPRSNWSVEALATAGILDSAAAYKLSRCFIE